MDSLATHNKMLETQITQLAQNASSSARPSGMLPGQPEINPRGHVNAITLRSGKQYEGPKMKENDGVDGHHEEKSKIVIDVDNETQMQEEEKVEKYVAPAPYKPPLPFPQSEAISQMPSYAKFLKEILSNKRKLEEYETVALTEEYSAIIQNMLPPKLKDPGLFSIPCVIGNVSINRALCDLGTSVSLMSMSICKKLGIGDLKPTTISLQLADRSVKYPVGILEDVPIQVGKFFIPVDFVILEIEEDSYTPIILGRPFLATPGAIIDVKNGRLSLNIRGETVEFDLSNTMKLPLTNKICYMVDVIDKCTHEQIANNNSADPLEKCLVSDGSINDEDPEVAAYAQSLESTSTAPLRNAKLERLMLEPKGSICEKDNAPKVELKPLPSSLRHEFLGPDSTYPVIVNACLNENETDKLLRTLGCITRS
ncbi:uncharacterized protein LOC109835559 [Asparagus officinalis]|uniref:uncharacterized protein LOC109835559 n=1 Tax=Asparagus officinalis TaxID=4686 RepID=UPI00098E2683|nr:uncharacterized protein LOC109835559 [Asparagus officinalis]